jgi:hypothetical protein
MEIELKKGNAQSLNLFATQNQARTTHSDSTRLARHQHLNHAAHGKTHGSQTRLLLTARNDFLHHGNIATANLV